MILDGLENHAQPTSAKTTIGLQSAELRLKLGIIWPITTHARLTRQVIFDRVAGARSIRLSHQGDELGYDFVVVLRRRAHEHSANHPTLDDVQSLDQLRLRNR